VNFIYEEMLKLDSLSAPSDLELTKMTLRDLGPEVLVLIRNICYHQLLIRDLRNMSKDGHNSDNGLP
jgi:hypothetical protein